MVGDTVNSSYSSVVKAIAMRTLTAEQVLDNLVENPDDPFAIAGCELATLQIRLICELLLLGAQIAHFEDDGVEISETKWRPVDAYAQLKDLSEHPLPMPVEVVLNKNGDGNHHIEPLSKPVEFDSISKVYGRCGDLLHAPTIKKIVNGKLPAFDVAMLRKWVADVKVLVGSHILMLPRRKTIYLSLWSGQIEDEPELYRLDAAGESSIELDKYPACELLA